MIAAPPPDDNGRHRRGLAARGLALARAGRHFEAHESWEELWLELAGEERLWLQALIQAVVALHHAESGNATGAASLAEKARVKASRLAAAGFAEPAWAAGLGLPGPARLLVELLAWRDGGQRPPFRDPGDGDPGGHSLL